MRENYTYKKCAACEGKKQYSNIRKNTGLFTNLFLVALPKCPLCIIAYSSTLMLCGKEETIISSQIHSSLIATGITIFFCAVVLVSLLLNYRDFRTKYAVALALAGSAMIISSTVFTLGPLIYFSGTGIIFSAIWLNGSMFYFLKKLKILVYKLQSPEIDYLSKI